MGKKKEEEELQRKEKEERLMKEEMRRKEEQRLREERWKKQKEEKDRKEEEERKKRARQDEAIQAVNDVLERLAEASVENWDQLKKDTKRVLEEQMPHTGLRRDELKAELEAVYEAAEELINAELEEAG